MPSQEPSIQDKGFRTSMFGFDKNDVLAYMNALANETQQREVELQQTIDELNAPGGEAEKRAVQRAYLRGKAAERAQPGHRPRRSRRKGGR